VRAGIGKAFQSLTVRNYRLFTAGQIVKLIGVWMQFTAQDWLVLELSGNSATALGIVTALQFTPVLLLTLYGGKLADRYDKRRLLIGANAAFSFLTLGLGLLVVTGHITLGWVYVSAALIGIVNAIETPVRQSFVSELVGRELLPNALSLSAATFNTARVIGPALGGLVIGLIGLSPVFLLNVVTYLAPAITLWRMRPNELHREPRAATKASIRAGLRYVLRRDDLVMPIVLVMLIGMFGFNFQLTLPVLAKVVFSVDATQFGLLTTALALGSLGGALASSLRRVRPSAALVAGAAVAFGALEILVAFGPTFWVTALLLLPAGFFMIFFAQSANQRVQLGTDAAYRGRVMALYVLVFLGTTPIGALLTGWLSEHFGARSGVWVGGAASLLVAIAALTWQLRRSQSRLGLRFRPRPRFYVVAKAPALAEAGDAVASDAVPAGMLR